MVRIHEPILVGVGGNLFFESEKAPINTCQAALDAIQHDRIVILKQSCWYLSSPVSDDNQPWYVNCVIRVHSELSPNALLGRLLNIERGFGRSPRARSGPRTLDLDLLAHGGVICVAQGQPSLTLPHPRMAQRGFVMRPLSDIMPEWRHPILGHSARDLACVERDGQNLVRLTPVALEI